MFRARASRISARAVLAAILLSSLVAAPAAGKDPLVEVVASSSPSTVTAGLPGAFPVTVFNHGKNTLNHVKVTAAIDDEFTFLFAEPAGVCTQPAGGLPTCSLGKLRGRGASVSAVFYFSAPTTLGTYEFTATAAVAEGGKDSSGASHLDRFQDIVEVEVDAPSQDFVTAFSVPSVRSFSTGGIDCDLLGLPEGCEPDFPLDETNTHGTRVKVPANAPVALADLPEDGDEDVDCPAVITTCFGAASSVSVGGGAAFAEGIEVTMRWDLSELPEEITPEELLVVHIFNPGVLVGGLNYEIVSDPCEYDVDCCRRTCRASRSRRSSWTTETSRPRCCGRSTGWVAAIGDPLGRSAQLRTARRRPALTTSRLRS